VNAKRNDSKKQRNDSTKKNNEPQLKSPKSKSLKRNRVLSAISK
jgi:hypothetical protein